MKIEKARQKNPDLPSLHLVSGLIYRARGRYDDSIREFNAVRAAAPKDVDVYNYLAMVYEDAGRLLQAEQLFRDAIELRHDYWKAYDSLGKFYLRRGRNDEAEKMFKRATDLAPDNARAIGNLAAVCIRTRQLQKAEELLKRSVAIHPTFAAYNKTSVTFISNKGAMPRRCQCSKTRSGLAARIRLYLTDWPSHTNGLQACTRRHRKRFTEPW